jgi:type II secretory pathway component PulF
MSQSNIKLSQTEKLALINNLSKLLEGGIPLTDAIDALLEDAKKNQKKVIETLKTDMQEGRTIAEALAKFPKSFDPITIGLIATGEKSGNLEKTFSQLSINLTADMELSGKLKAAIAYPIFVMIVFFSVLLLILVFVIPRIASVFLRLKLHLPLTTKILITTSSLLKENTLIFLTFFFLSIVLIIFVFKKRSRFIINILAKLPILSGLATQIDLERFTRSLGIMLSTSIPIDEALDLTKNVVYKKNIKQIIEACLSSVQSGKKISETFKQNPKIIPTLMTRMVEVGEKSGSLDQALLSLSTYFQNKIDSTIKTLTIMLEPILLVIIGVLVGGIMVSIIAPIYTLIGSISPR